MVALEAFAYAYNIDIPGVQVPAGVKGTDVPDDGSLVTKWVQEHWDELNAAQQSAINPYITPDPNDKTITIDLQAPVGVSRSQSSRGYSQRDPIAAYEQAPAPPPRPLSAAHDEPSQELQDAMKADLLADIEHIGQRLGLPKINEGFLLWTNVTLDLSDKDGGNIIFLTGSPENAAGIYAPCDMTAYSNAWQGEQVVGGKVSDRLHVLITHEVVHCYQNAVWGSIAVHQAIPDWINEGTALWLAADDTGITETMVPSQWRLYFATPGEPLFNRTYDAFSYFALLDHLGRDLWSQMAPAWQAAATAARSGGQDPSEAFIASLTGDATDVRDAWATSFLRESSWGDPWIAYGFGLPADAQVVRQPIGASPAPGFLGQIDTRANVVDEVQEAAGEIVLVQTDGIASARDGQAHSDMSFQSARFCVEGDCICPPDTERAGERVADEDMTMPFALAINSTKGGAIYRVVGRTLAEECGPKDDDPFPPAGWESGTGTSACGSGCIGSNGDPHLRTVNNVYYDFQAGGEFTLLRSPDSSLEIQARQEPFQSSNHVAINTAIGAHDNGHKVGVYFTGDDFVAHVDGAVVDAAVPIDLGNGAALSEHERGFEIDFPDGTQLWLLTSHEYGINAQIRPSEELRTNGVGLLGPVLPGGLAVPKLADGTRLPRASDKHQQYQLTYHDLADSWRVTNATSLFDYDAGKSTASYTVAAFPTEQASTTPADLTDAQRSQAAAACAGTTDLGLLEQCLFDVTVTGQAGFGSVYASISDLTWTGVGTLNLPVDTAPPPPTSTPGPPTTPSPTGTQVPAPTNAVLTGLESLHGAAVGPDGTLYVSVAYPNDVFKVVAVDPASGQMRNEVVAQAGGQLAVAAGSLWAAEFTGTNCSVTRLDLATLAVQATVTTVCNDSGTNIASDGAAVWFPDNSLDDFTREGLRRIDPATNVVADPIIAPALNGFLIGTTAALIYVSGENGGGLYRLPVGATELQPLGARQPPFYPSGAGVWTQNGDSAEFFAQDGPAAQVIPIDGSLITADDHAVYADQSSTVDFTDELWAYPIDGSDPVRVAGVPPPYGDITFGYFDNDPILVGPGGLVKIWVAVATDTSPSALFAQWIPTGP